MAASPHELEDFEASEAEKFKYTHWLDTFFVSIFFHVKHPRLEQEKKRDIVSCQVSTAGGAAVMPAAVRPAVVSLSVGRTPPQTRAGDARGRHPLASAADCVRVCVYACVRVCVHRRGITKGRGLETLSFSPAINYTVST